MIFIYRIGGGHIMDDIAKKIGDRIRIYRNNLGYTQEILAEKANLHNTYIGQLERGDKNATLESIEKVCKALEIPLEVLFKKIITSEKDFENDIPSKVYDLVNSLKPTEQNSFYKIIKEIISFKNN